ncbi:hypothetical protein MNBD_GAMMA08-11 [hydrothermal vent metagenome]|uniref:Uncharacterized protein n=1 Tax=hydrothermal vent metagenome TaxID=652676 RepID=A0A3B0XTD0_9ZZZZ
MIILNIKQNKLVKNMLGKHRIHTIDERGYYIVNGDGNSGGVFYLYDDGIIRKGVQGFYDNPTGADAFWPTEKEAYAFLFKWSIQTKCVNNIGEWL